MRHALLVHLARPLVAALSIAMVLVASPALGQTSLCCPADLDGDGEVGAADLALVLGGWDTPQTDLDGDGSTGPSDLAILLGAWGPCTARPCLLTRVVGAVVLENGTPVESAVVASDQDGEGVSDAAGAFAFDVEVPHDVSELHVTAVAHVRGVSYSGTKVLSPIGFGGVTGAGAITVTARAECEQVWRPTFGGAPGADNGVFALMAFDDGSGDGLALYAAGSFTTIGGVAANSIAKWEGGSWSPLGDGVNGVIRALAVFDDGSGGGPALYAGGGFGDASGVPGTNRIAKWDGSSWSALGSGMDATVFALAVFDDGSGSGPALYAGGSFFQAGDRPAVSIAKWDGSSWSGLGSGMNGSVSALATFDDLSGSGSALYVGGSFSAVDGLDANYVARWDGSSWSTLGLGMSGLATLPGVSALTVFDDRSGRGPALYAAGNFTVAGSTEANRIAKWDGSSWSSLGEGLGLGAFDHVRTLTVFDAGGREGPALFAGGTFAQAPGVAGTSRIAKWDGVTWSPLVTGVSNEVSALAEFDDRGGGGPNLFVGGNFTIASGLDATRIARWDGASWSAFPSGLNGSVLALATLDPRVGGSVDMYAGGSFTQVGGTALGRIARWDGATWTPLGSGMSSAVLALAIFDDGKGGGPALYAGGQFVAAGGVQVNYIAKWDGASWSPLDSGFNGPVSALAVFDDGMGGGPALYAGGGFTQAGEGAVHRIAKWDGTTWSKLGPGLNASVSALTVFDDGSGPALYVGGAFSVAGQVDANRIAKWDGSTWSPLGAGLGNIPFQLVRALASTDGASGAPALYAGGTFTTAGGVTANAVARWDGSSWSSLGSGISGNVHALTILDDGSGGTVLYAGGGFSSAGGVAAKGVARWDGESWSPVAGGLSGFVPVARAFALVHDESGSPPALRVGGDFTASPAGDSFLATWGCASPSSR